MKYVKNEELKVDIWDAYLEEETVFSEKENFKGVYSIQLFSKTIKKENISFKRFKKDGQNLIKIGVDKYPCQMILFLLISKYRKHETNNFDGAKRLN